MKSIIVFGKEIQYDSLEELKEILKEDESIIALKKKVARDKRKERLEIAKNDGFTSVDLMDCYKEDECRGAGGGSGENGGKSKPKKMFSGKHYDTNWPDWRKE